MTIRNAPDSVIVVGGGVVGLCCAHYLSRAGLRVTVLERSRLGSGASRGNAGEVCPDLAEPLGAPGIVSKALGGLPRPDNPLWIHPVPSVQLLSFLARFGLRSTGSRHARGAAALAGLAEGTFTLFEELESLGVDAQASKDGYIFAYPTAKSAARGLAAYQRLGAPVAAPGLLAGQALADLEPALGHAARAGFLVGRQWAIDPSLFVDTLAGRLRRSGTELVEGARVTGIQDHARRAEVRTAAGTISTCVATRTVHRLQPANLRRPDVPISA